VAASERGRGGGEGQRERRQHPVLAEPVSEPGDLRGIGLGVEFGKSIRGGGAGIPRRREQIPSSQ
jgi:hypothetical protein